MSFSGIAALVVVVCFAFVLGVSDAPNASAVLIASRAASYRGAMVFSFVASAAGGLFAGEAVALTMTGLVHVSAAELPGTYLAGGLASLAFTLLLTRRGVPVSASISLVGGLAGAAGAQAGWGVVGWGAAITSYGQSSGSDKPAETETVLLIWRAEGRVREEREGGPRDGAYAVRDGDVWWSWDARSGAMSNQDDPTVGFSVGEEVSLMLDPTPLLGSLRFAPAGRGIVAGREVIGETSIIIEHVAGAQLVPSLEARKWDRLCDQYVSDAVQAIVLDTIEERFDERAVARARGRLDMAYGMLDAQLTQHEFLAGDTFTIADCAAAPGLFYALAIHPWDEGTHPQLTRYYRALAHRPSFANVIAEARPYRHLFPLPWPADFDRYH